MAPELLPLIRPVCYPPSSSLYIENCVEDTSAAGNFGRWIGHCINMMLPTTPSVWTSVLVIVYGIIIVLGYAYGGHIMAWAFAQKREGGAGGFVLFLIAAAVALLFYFIGSAIVLIGALIIISAIISAIKGK